MLVFAACSRKSQQAALTQVEPENPRIPLEWNIDNITKVVGYRFRISGEDAKGNHPTGSFTLCRDSKVDLATLEKLKDASVELDSAQTRLLLDLVFSDAEPLPHIACYSPHQIFVFYDSEGAAKRAVEICFLCNGVVTVPSLPEAQWRKHDLMALAKLCSELGIWANYQKIEDYIPPGTEMRTY